MGAVEEGGKVATSVVESMKGQPLALAVIVVNVLFLVGGLWFLHEIATLTSARQQRNDQLLVELVRECSGGPKQPHLDQGKE